MKEIIIFLLQNEDQEMIATQLAKQLDDKVYHFSFYHDPYDVYKEEQFNKASLIFVSYFRFQKNLSILFFLERLHLPLLLFYYRAEESMFFYQINKVKSNALLEVIKNIKTYLTLHANNGVIKIHFHNIRYLESNRMYVYIHTKGTIHKIRTQLNRIQPLLPASFLRCHQSFIINASFVFLTKRIELQLLDGKILPISKRYSKEIRQYFNSN